jgi:hypothetical protein
MTILRYSSFWLAALSLLVLYCSPCTSMPVNTAVKTEVVRTPMSVQFQKKVSEILGMTPKQLDDVDSQKMHRPEVAVLVHRVHYLTNAHKTHQLVAHERGNVLGVQEATRNLKELKPHVDFVKEAHQAVLNRKLVYHKEHARLQVEAENEQHNKLVEEMVQHVSTHPPRLTKATSLPSRLNKGKSLAKTVKSSLSLPASIRNKWSSSSSSGSSQN